MKKLSNDKEYAVRNLYKTNFHLPLGLNCAHVVFRVYIYMLDAEHRGVASEILGFSRLIQTPERKPTFEKVISMDLHCKRNQGTLG